MWAVENKNWSKLLSHTITQIRSPPTATEVVKLSLYFQKDPSTNTNFQA